MKAASLLLILIFVGSYVAGQLLLKRAMDLSVNTNEAKDRRMVSFLIMGIAAMTVSFFVSIGLLQHFDLSYLYPFTGLSVIIITVFARLVLKERLTFRLVAGAILISAGVGLVSAS